MSNNFLGHFVDGLFISVKKLPHNGQKLKKWSIVLSSSLLSSGSNAMYFDISGCVSAVRNDDDTGVLGAFIVRKDLRGKGIGKPLTRQTCI